MVALMKTNILGNAFAIEVENIDLPSLIYTGISNTAQHMDALQGSYLTKSEVRKSPTNRIYTTTRSTFCT